MIISFLNDTCSPLRYRLFSAPLSIVLRSAIESPLDFLHTGLSSYELFTNFSMRRMPVASWVSPRIMLEYSLDILFVLRYAIESPLDFLHVYQNIELTRIIRSPLNRNIPRPSKSTTGALLPFPKGEAAASQYSTYQLVIFMQNILT